MNEYETALYELRYGNPSTGLTLLSRHDKESLDILHNLSNQWLNYQKPVLLQIMALPPEERFKSSKVQGFNNQSSCQLCHSAIRERLYELGNLITSIERHHERDIRVYNSWRVFFAAVLFALSIGFVIYSKKKVVDPLLRVKEATKFISRGDFDIKISEKSGGEIGELINSINEMAHSLKKSYEDNLKQIQYLKILNELSSTVNSSLSLELICSKAIDTILKLEGLSIERKGAIFITEEDSTGKKLRMICHKGFTEDFKNSESVIPSGNCLCGLSAETGEIIISESAIEDKRHTRRYPGMLDHGHIVLPIKASDGIIGVLCLYLPPKSRPSREEIDLLKAISDVLGVAIQNTKNFKTVEILLKELESQQERLRATLNTVPDCIKIIDREGILIDINPAGLQILKASSPEEVLGRSIFSMVESEFQEELRSIINRAFLDGLPGYIQLKIRDLTNEVHYIEGRYAPLKNTEGNIIAVLSISRDITEYKRLEAQLYHTQKMEAIGQLAGGIAHDFNNMLNAIIGFGSLMDMQIGEDDPAKSYLREMMKAAERAADLTKRLLIFSRKQQIKPEPVDLNEIILDFQKIIRRLIGEDILLKIQTHGEKIMVLADRGQIEQVLMNLATNARDAMPDGGTITIKTSVEEINKEFIKKHGYGKPRKYGTIIFSDTGCGMEQKVLSRVFEPYFTTKEYGRGTGLGLAIVYGIIKQHDGYIDVWSEPGKGTRFTIYLPLIHDVVSEEKSEHIQIQPGHGELILVAEDSEEVMKAIKTMLTTFGYRVLEAKKWH